MSEDPARRPRLPVHPVDLLLVAVAVALGAVAYAYLFRRSPVPRPVDPLLGVVLEVEFDADRDWKREFPVAGQQVMVEEYLVAETLSAGPAPGGTGRMRRARIRVLDREYQRPDTMTMFRTGIFRGTRVRVTSEPGRCEVQGEVVAVEAPGERK